MSRAMILTYHAIERGPAPLCVDPDLFARHVDELARSGVELLTVRALAARLARGGLEQAYAAVTFDDGFTSVVEAAAPVLAAAGVPATVFCVAGHVGGIAAWEASPASGRERPLADAAALRELTAAGWEVGAHGMTHRPLGEPGAALEEELGAARRVLEQAVGVPVRSFAYPYGSTPDAAGLALVRATYDAACTTRLGTVSARADVHLLPRVDAHYVRRPDVLRRLLEGRLEGYLQLRSLGARARRVVRKDYFTPLATG